MYAPKPLHTTGVGAIFCAVSHVKDVSMHTIVLVEFQQASNAQKLAGRSKNEVTSSTFLGRKHRPVSMHSCTHLSVYGPPMLVRILAQHLCMFKNCRQKESLSPQQALKHTHKRHGTLASCTALVTSQEHMILDMLLLARRIHKTCVRALSLSFAGLCTCCCY